MGEQVILAPGHVTPAVALSKMVVSSSLSWCYSTPVERELI